MNRPSQFDPSKGLWGNIEEALWGNQYRKNEIENNKSAQDSVNANTEDIMCELDTVDRIAEIEEALCELDERIGGTL